MSYYLRKKRDQLRHRAQLIQDHYALHPQRVLLGADMSLDAEGWKASPDVWVCP